ncbi:MAG TPA: hypothetical protein VF789_29740 [Thermoanaerobaculia bacterium]
MRQGHMGLMLSHARSTQLQPLGREAILDQHPHHQPETIKKSAKPRIHAASHAIPWWFYEVYS